MTDAPVFDAWLDEFFASYYRHRPVNATFIGVHEYDWRLPDLSERGMADTIADMRSLLDRLHALPDEPLTGAQGMDRRLAEGFLEIQLWEYESGHFWRGNPSLYAGEAIFGAISLFLRPFAPIGQRVEAAIDRIGGIPTLLDQAQRNVRRAPLGWTERAIRECIGAIAFLTDGVDLLIAEENIGDARLRMVADDAAAAFYDFQRYLETDLSTHPTEGYACGADGIDLLIRRGHFLTVDADAIDAYAREQFAAAEAYLTEHAGDFGAAGWREALAQLAELHPPVDEYYARYEEYWEANRAAAAEHDLLTWPDYPIVYVPQPVWAREAAPDLYFLFYRSPAPFDRVVPVDYLVTPIDREMAVEEQERRLRATNDSVIKLNHVVHHGGMGHHVQNWYASQAASRIGQIAAVDCASRIAMLCGGTMAEGWAVYATELMDEIGFTTPLEHYSEVASRLRMAARAIVDIGLHTGAMSFEEAIAFYRDRTGMSPEAARSEAVKNGMFPGAALMYLMGADGIRDLRAKLAARDPDFSLHRFHDRLLSYGSVPVSLIAESMLNEPSPAATP